MNTRFVIYLEKLVQYENLDNHIEELMQLDNATLETIKDNTNNYNKATINQVLKHREARG